MRELAASPKCEKHRLSILTAPSLMVVNEIGYLPVSQTGAILFNQMMSRRCERASTVLTSNMSFEEWGEVLGDEVMAVALIDRMLYYCHIVNTSAAPQSHAPAC